MLKRHNIHFYTSENEDIKAAVVERFNRALKTKMYRYFTFKNTWRYIDIYSFIRNECNNTQQERTNNTKEREREREREREIHS